MTNWVERIDQKLDQDLSSRQWPCSKLSEAMHYAVCNGGKRTRATLCYITGTGLRLTLEQLDRMAMAIECLHAYTLVHDDLPAMDDDDWRRYQPSCHKAFDEATAILAGDALQTHAFTILSEGNTDNKIEQIRFFAEAVGASGLCSGQSLDMTHNSSSSLETIRQIHTLKTAVLLGAACRLPGIAAGCNAVELDQLQNFGEKLGLLLQANDDLIDGDSNTGKSAGKDFQQNKASLGSTLITPESTDVLRKTLEDCNQSLKDLRFLTKKSQNQLSDLFCQVVSAALLTK